MHGSKLGASARAGVFFLLVVGCGSDSPTATSTVSNQPAAASPTQSPRTLTVKLVPNNDPVKATLTIDISGSGYTMTVAATGLTPNSKHLLNLHPGTTCAVQGDELNPATAEHVDLLNADAKGNLTSVTTWPRAYSVPSKGRILAIHGNSGTLDDGGHIACADMPR